GAGEVADHHDLELRVRRRDHRPVGQLVAVADAEGVDDLLLAGGGDGEGGVRPPAQLLGGARAVEGQRDPGGVRPGPGGDADDGDVRGRDVRGRLDRERRRRRGGGEVVVAEDVGHAVRPRRVADDAVHDAVVVDVDLAVAVRVAAGGRGDRQVPRAAA